MSEATEKTEEQIAADAAEAASKAEAKKLKDAEKAAKKEADKAAKEADKAQKAAAKEEEKKAAAEKKAQVEADKAAAKAAAEAAKESSRMPEANGIRRPKPDTLCGKAWAVFDAISAQTGQPASIADSLAEAKKQGLNEGNVRAEYARWRKFFGVTGRVKAVTAPAAE